MQQNPLVSRIDAALDASDYVYSRFTPGDVEASIKSGGDPVTKADLELDRVLKESLLLPDEGWLSEETADNHSRLDAALTWIVDPLDGTREFATGIPEFCTSIAAVVDGVVVAGGVYNPAADVRIVGSVDGGVLLNGTPAMPLPSRPLRGMTVLASRSEVNRGEWEAVAEAGINVVPMGSVAYKMARVAAGLNEATWTLIPKHEWDVAAGSGLLRAVGGAALGLTGAPLTFNQPRPWFDGVIAVPPGFDDHVQSVIAFNTAS